MQRSTSRHVSAWGQWGLGSVLVLALLSGLSRDVHADHMGIPGVRPAVDPTLGTYEPTANLAGNLTISGSDTMRPLIIKLATAFNRLHPGMKFTVEGGGTTAGIREFIIGYSNQRRGEKARSAGHLGGNQVTILASSRELTASEGQAFASRYGYEPFGIPIAMDAVTVYVNAQNPLRGLALEQVDAIFSKTHKRGLSEDITTWGQLGLNGVFQRQPIHLYGRDKRSGTREVFIKTALKGGELKESVQEQQGSAMELLTIAQNPFGIGYAGAMFETEAVRIVPLARQVGEPFVEPTPDSVASGTYPLTRFLYLYLRKAPDEPFDPGVLEFLKFLNSREGQETVVRARFFPLASSQVVRNLAVLDGNVMAAAVPVSLSKLDSEPEVTSDSGGGQAGGD